MLLKPGTANGELPNPRLVIFLSPVPRFPHLAFATFSQSISATYGYSKCTTFTNDKVLFRPLEVVGVHVGINSLLLRSK